MAGKGRTAIDREEHSTIELLERELARAYRIERALRDVGLALGTTLDLDSLLRLILERTTEALEAERATLYLLEQKRRWDPTTTDDISGMSVERSPSGETRWETMLVSRVVEGGAIDEIALHVGQGIAGEVARTGRAANVRDAYTDARFSRAWDERTGFRTRAVLCVPLRSQLGRVIGVIQVLNKRPGGLVSDTGSWSQTDLEDTPAYFDEDDEALLAALAAQAAVSIEQARLFASILDKNRELQGARSQLEKKVEDLNVLFAIERATARATTREELALAILPEAARACGGRTAYVVLGDEAGDLTLFHIGVDAVDAAPPDSLAPPSRGSRPSAPMLAAAPVSASTPPYGTPSIQLSPAIRRLRVKAGEGLIGTAIASGTTVVVADLARDVRQSPRIAEALFPGREHVGAPCAIVPLVDETEHAFGALAVVRRGGDKPFDDDDVDLLRLLALNASTGFQLQRAREASAQEARLSTIGSLVSGMLHDLKTPMTIISGYVQMMASDDDKTARAEFADLVLRQFDHIAAMQKEVLAFARGERTVLVRRVYLAKFFEEIERSIRYEIERRKSKVDLVVELKDRGIARFDEAKITRALYNLARNAVEAMGSEGGHLTISVGRTPAPVGSELGSIVIISVADTGPGIPPEVQERLFQSFVTAGKPTGTGLGLAIVKKIAEDHGGTIEAASSPSGARFTLRLPQPQENALKRTPTPSQVR